MVPEAPSNSHHLELRRLLRSMERFEERNLFSILWLHRLPSPLQPDTPELPVLFYFLMLRSLIPSSSSVVSNWNFSPLLFLFHTLFSLTYLCLFQPFPLCLCLVVSSCLPFISPSPTISHISLYPLVFHPQHPGSQSPRSWAPSSGLPHI